jgi:hypothetical protein
MRRGLVVTGIAILGLVPAMLAIPSAAGQAGVERPSHPARAGSDRSTWIDGKATAPPHGGVYFLGEDELKRWALRRDSRLMRAGFLPSQRECAARGRPNNLRLDCDDTTFWTPNNEPHIVVDPADADHMIASSNDYESCCDAFYTTFDGGRTWHTGDMSAESDHVIGSDPVTAIDPKHNVAIHASLNFGITAQGLATDGDVVVSRSTDGGLTWQRPVVVYDGHGDEDDPVQVFNDKEWVVTDTNPASPHYGRTYLTWTRFLSHNGNVVESPIWASFSDDGGRTWAPAREISGRSQTCTYQESGRPLECDEDQASTPAVGPDGTVYVAFQNEQHEAAWEGSEVFENQYMVVRSHDGGRTWLNPAHAVDLEDGSRDFPLNVDGSQTLDDWQIRVPTLGDLAVSPVDGTLYLVFTDNRHGVHDVARPQTDADVFIMSSNDDGAHWQGPWAVTPRNTDQWFPSVDVDPATGKIGVVYHDRTSFGEYVTALSQGRNPAHLNRRVITDDHSHVRDSLYFRARVKGCYKCATFHGDYIGLAYGSDGAANAVWTDMRRLVTVQGSQGHFQQIFYSRLP